MAESNRNYLVVALVFLVAIIFVSSFAYSYYESYNFWQSLFYMVLTVTTVGSGKYLPETVAGEAVTLLTVVFGMGVVLLVASVFAKQLVLGQTRFEHGLLTRMRNVFASEEEKEKKLKKHHSVKVAKRKTIFSHF